MPQRGQAIELLGARGVGPGAIPVAMSAGDTGVGCGGIDGGTVGSGGSPDMPGTPPSGPYAGNGLADGVRPSGPEGTNSFRM